MAPLCFCHGMSATADEPVCCHAPQGEEKEPCPHCDQTCSLALPFGFKPVSAPAVEGVKIPSIAELEIALQVHSLEAGERANRPVENTGLPPERHLHARLGVFLI